MKVKIIVSVLLLCVNVSAQTTLATIVGLDKEIYKQKVIQLTRDLGSYLKYVSDKENPDDAIWAEGKALELFVNSESTVEVSSLRDTTKVKVYKIGEYLTHLRLLPYTFVKLRWFDVSYVDELRKNPDGSYSGTVTVSQEFLGIIDGKLVYGDITQKTLEIVLRPRETIIGGLDTLEWDILFNDIKVTSTREG